MSTTLEKTLEFSFVKWCRDHRIAALKGPVGLSKGFPDRFAMLPDGGGTIYVEFKGTSYYDLTEIQKWWQKYLLKCDPHRYFVVTTKEELAQLEEACLAFMEIGPKLVEYERNLLNARAIMKTNQEEK